MVYRGSVGTSKRVSKKDVIQHGDGVLPVRVVLYGDDPWSGDEVLQVIQGIPWPLVPQFSVRIKVVDEIDKKRCQRTSSVKIE